MWPASGSVRYSSNPQSRGVSAICRHLPAMPVAQPVCLSHGRPGLEGRFVAGAKAVAPRHQGAARRIARRHEVTLLKAKARFRHRVNVRCLALEAIRAVAADAIDPNVVGEEEDDVGALLRSECRMSNVE